MKKWLVLFALAEGLLACADGQSADVDERAAEPEALPQMTSFQDAGVSDYQIFGGAAKLTNVGATCSAPTDCKGSGARCMTAIPLINAPISGGFCTAGCKRDSECGTGGGCPLAPIADLAKLFLPDAGALVDNFAICLKKCKTDSECRDGLPCQAIPIPAIPLVPQPNSKYCLPPLPDAGSFRLPDGGIPRLPDGGLPSFPGFPGFPGLPGAAAAAPG